MSTLKFNGASGRKPQTEARRYVYRIIFSMLDSEFNEPDFHQGWMFGGIENSADRRRLTKAIRAVQKEMLRKVGEAEPVPGKGMSAPSTQLRRGRRRKERNHEDEHDARAASR